MRGRVVDRNLNNNVTRAIARSIHANKLNNGTHNISTTPRGAIQQGELRAFVGVHGLYIKQTVTMSEPLAAHMRTVKLGLGYRTLDTSERA